MVTRKILQQVLDFSCQFTFLRARGSSFPCTMAKRAREFELSRLICWCFQRYVNRIRGISDFFLTRLVTLILNLVTRWSVILIWTRFTQLISQKKKRFRQIMNSCYTQKNSQFMLSFLLHILLSALAISMRHHRNLEIRS